MSHSSQKHIVIVGGGYLGAMAAILFTQENNCQVTLVEKQDKLCGLYNTAHEMNDRFFDYGSRAILETGVSAVDEALLSILPEDEYPRTTANLKEFSYQNGQYLDYSNCLDARTLSEDLFKKGKEEMLAIPDTGKSYDDYNTLEEYCLATHGKIFSEHLIAPAIKKLTSLDMTDLDPSSLVLHGLHRLIIADQDASKALKEESDFNGNRIAFARYDDNKSTMIKTYPLRLGLSDYAERIKNYLNDQPNVTLALNTSVVGVTREDDRISHVELEDGTQIETSALLWTIPAIFFAKMQNIQTSDLKPPTFRNSVLAHYITDGAINTDAYFIYNYDTECLAYRTTFYDNFSETSDEFKSMTVELFHDALDPDLEVLNDKVFDELIQTGAISSASRKIASHVQFHRGSWPNFACGFFDNQLAMNELAQDNIENLFFAGKANGKHHSAALVHTVNDLSDSILNQP